jgi:hypothetical protein
MKAKEMGLSHNINSLDWFDNCHHLKTELKKVVAIKSLCKSLRLKPILETTILQVLILHSLHIPWYGLLTINFLYNGYVCNKIQLNTIMLKSTYKIVSLKISKHELGK